MSLDSSQFRVRLPVLLYHHVGPARSGVHGSLTVSPSRFQRQISWLARHGYRGICPSEWLHYRRETKAPSSKLALLTFDDAYADLVEHALPVLSQHGFGAAVFVVTGLVS